MHTYSIHSSILKTESIQTQYQSHNFQKKKKHQKAFKTIKKIKSSNTPTGSRSEPSFSNAPEFGPSSWCTMGRLWPRTMPVGRLPLQFNPGRGRSPGMPRRHVRAPIMGPRPGKTSTECRKMPIITVPLRAYTYVRVLWVFYNKNLMIMYDVMVRKSIFLFVFVVIFYMNILKPI